MHAHSAGQGRWACGTLYVNACFQWRGVSQWGWREARGPTSSFHICEQAASRQASAQDTRSQRQFDWKEIREEHDTAKLGKHCDWAHRFNTAQPQ